MVISEKHRYEIGRIAELRIETAYHAIPSDHDTCQL